MKRKQRKRRAYADITFTVIQMMIRLFEPGLVKYPEKMIDKPVRYTEDDLKDVAEKINRANITDEHHGKVIGEMNDITFKDGALCAVVPDDLEYEGKGFSPSFYFGLIDMGEYYAPYNLSMMDVARTSKPKNQIFYNSIKRGENMDLQEKEELLNTISDNQKRIRQQEQEIGILKNKEKEYKKKLSEKNDVSNELSEKEKELESIKAENEKLKTKAEKYDNIESAEKEALIKEISGENEEVRERLSKMSLDDIKFLSDKKLITTNPKGVPAGSAPGLQDGSQGGDDDGDDKPVTYDDYQAWKKENNVR